MDLKFFLSQDYPEIRQTNLLCPSLFQREKNIVVFTQFLMTTREAAFDNIKLVMKTSKYQITIMLFMTSIEDEKKLY